MGNFNILVFGPSHAGALQSLISNGFAMPGIRFTVYGIHGAAYRNADLAHVDGSYLRLRSVAAEGSKFDWNSDQNCDEPVLIQNFDAIFLLEPLFLSAGYMRDVLWEQRKGVCPVFLSGLEKYFPATIIGDYVPISTALWLTIYKHWRPGSIKLIECIRTIATDIPILILPPVNPPARLNPAAYAYYCLREQLFLGNQLSSMFGSKFFLQPRCTLDERLCTLDRYHQPTPDPHHPTPEYYRLLLESIDYETFDISSPLQWDLNSLL